MKKLLAVVMATVLAASLAGCGADTGTDKEGTKKTETGSGYVYNAPTGVEEAGIYIEPIEGISDDFMRGVDISSVISEEASGVKYYNLKGEEEDLFKILADAGVNYIRVRVWNDPYDENGNGYGGGNCDAEKAAEIGRRAAQYGMKLFVDFHYSDFWADPGKQMCPKAWEGMSASEKAEACYSYTLDAMNKILDAGADVGMVQLGNETNPGMSGETKWLDGIAGIINRGRDAVLEAGAAHGNDNILIAVHFTNIENFDGIKGVLRKLESSGVQYDVFAVSYYPYWHGSFENLTNVLNYVQEKYEKKVVIAETSYPYTTDEGDGTGNSVSEAVLCKEYAATPQSQANAVRDICEVANNAGALGVFYWEPAWIPVNDYDYTAADAEIVLEKNKEAWETHGSGWASSYAADYDPGDAGKWYGGSSWDNQAFFDHTGHALASVNVYRYLKYGSTCELKVDFANNLLLDINPGFELKMPEAVPVQYNDRTKNGDAPITWNAEQVAAIDTNVMGDYEVVGTFEDGSTILCTVRVAKVNLVKNGSFEDKDTSAWTIYTEGDPCVDFQQKETDAYTGEWSMHYWRSSAVNFKAEQTFSGLENGTYYLSMYTQGGDSGAGASMYLYANNGETEYKQDYVADGWCNWQFVEIKDIKVTDGTLTIGVSFDGGNGAWGTFDDFYLCIVE